MLLMSLVVSCYGQFNHVQRIKSNEMTQYIGYEDKRRIVVMRQHHVKPDRYEGYIIYEHVCNVGVQTQHPLNYIAAARWYYQMKKEWQRVQKIIDDELRTDGKDLNLEDQDGNIK
jgi:hypothetical protein